MYAKPKVLSNINKKTTDLATLISELQSCDMSADVWRKEDVIAAMLNLLDKISPTECPKLLHRVVDGLCGRGLPKRREYGETWSLLEWGELISSLTTFFRVAVGRKHSDQEVQELLGDLKSVHAEAILQCLHARQEEIRQALVDRTNRICSTQLDDFNWQLKLALSSDKLSSLNTPLLNLCLDLTENGIQRAVNIEMNKEELNTLITALEAANKMILQMK